MHFNLKYIKKKTLLSKSDRSVALWFMMVHSFWMFTWSAIVMTPFLIGDFQQSNWADMPLHGWGDIAFIVLVCSVLCYILLPIGQKTVRPTAVAMYNYIRPVASAVLSALMGLAIVDWHTALYSLLIFSGVWLVSGGKK